MDGKSAVVHVHSGSDWRATPVTVGALGETDAVITAGIKDGAVLRRKAGGSQP
jgi:hypothetical protein